MYREFRDSQQKMFDDFADKNAFFAFNDEQFEEGLKKLGIRGRKTESVSKNLVHAGAGMYLWKSAVPEYKSLISQLDKELREKMQNKRFAEEAFYYELGNHEYCITFDSEPAIEALGYTVDEVIADKKLFNAWCVAKRKYIAECEQRGW